MHLPLKWYAKPFRNDNLTEREYIDIVAVNQDNGHLWLWRLTKEQVLDLALMRPAFWDIIAKITKRHEEYACAAH